MGGQRELEEKKFSKHLKNEKTKFPRTRPLESEALKIDQSQAERKGERRSNNSRGGLMSGSSIEGAVNVGSQTPVTESSVWSKQQRKVVRKEA